MKKYSFLVKAPSAVFIILHLPPECSIFTKQETGKFILKPFMKPITVFAINILPLLISGGLGDDKYTTIRIYTTTSG